MLTFFQLGFGELFVVKQDTALMDAKIIVFSRDSRCVDTSRQTMSVIVRIASDAFSIRSHPRHHDTAKLPRAKIQSWGHGWRDSAAQHRYPERTHEEDGRTNVAKTHQVVERHRREMTILKKLSAPPVLQSACTAQAPHDSRSPGHLPFLGFIASHLVIGNPLVALDETSLLFH